MKCLLYVWMMQNAIVSASVLKRIGSENQTKSQICKIKRKPIQNSDYVNFILCRG